MKKLHFLPAGLILCLTSAHAGESTSASSSPTPLPNKKAYNLFNPTPATLRRAFNADRPSKTDSPYTIDAGAFQLEADLANWTLDRTNPEHANKRVRSWIVAPTNFKLGLTNWADLQILPQGYVNRRTSGSDFGAPVEQSGIGDTTIRLKINLLGNDGGKLAVGFVSSLKLPTNSDHLGNSAYEPGFGLPVAYALPGGFTFFGQTRIDILDQTQSSERRVQWSNPIGLSRTIAGNLSGYAEFYNAVSSGKDQSWIGTADIGLIYQVNPDFSIDLSSFFGLTRNADDLNIFAGFSRRF